MGRNEGFMLESIIKINQAVNGFIWGVPAMICIIGVGLLLSVRTRFIQVRKFGAALKNTIGKIFDKTQAKDGSMSPFQAVCTALAGTVGTGNIAGVAGAIALGGPGAIFWMWCSAFLGMCTKFSEVTLAIHFREKNANGEYVGGPMYYIKNGLSKKWHFLAVLYALFGVLTVFGTGNATQVNTIVSSIHSALHNLHIIDGTVDERANLIFGIFIAAFVAMVLLGGIQRIGQVSEKLVPFMAALYVILAIGVVILHISRVPAVLAMIFKSAFTPQAATGGIIGSMFLSMKKGVSRGIFSNEAGLGTGSIAHACADTNNAVHQGMFGIFEVFMDTIVICTLTGLVILLGAPNIVYGQAAGAELTISGFTATYGGWVSIFTAVAMCCFAFSTIIGWGLYGSRCIEFLGGEKLVRPFLCIDHRCNNQPWSALGYCRYLQRSDGDSQPDRPAYSLRAGQEACDRCRSGGKKRHAVKQLHRHTIEFTLCEHSIVMNNRADCRRSALLLCHPSRFSISPRNFFTAAVT